MTRNLIAAALLLAAFANPAFASYAPVKYHASRQDIAASRQTLACSIDCFRYERKVFPGHVPDHMTPFMRRLSWKA